MSKVSAVRVFHFEDFYGTGQYDATGYDFRYSPVGPVDQGEDWLSKREWTRVAFGGRLQVCGGLQIQIPERIKKAINLVAECLCGWHDPDSSKHGTPKEDCPFCRKVLYNEEVKWPWFTEEELAALPTESLIFEEGGGSH